MCDQIEKEKNAEWRNEQRAKIQPNFFHFFGAFKVSLLMTFCVNVKAKQAKMMKSKDKSFILWPVQLGLFVNVSFFLICLWLVQHFSRIFYM